MHITLPTFNEGADLDELRIISEFLGSAALDIEFQAKQAIDEQTRQTVIHKGRKSVKQLEAEMTTAQNIVNYLRGFKVHIDNYLDQQSDDGPLIDVEARTVN
jgi:hypothetical protein